MTVQHIAKKFGFAYATTDYQEILKDKAIGSVIITTRHNSHATLVLEALTAGKHVLVEKPLCLTSEELEEISAAYDGSRLLMVGFNRRFAPLARQVKAMVAGRTTPLMMTYRVNAGYIPGDHWVHDPEVGGGRLRGEVCHFIDFLHFMTGSETASVNVETISGATGKYRYDDNLIINLNFQRWFNRHHSLHRQRTQGLFPGAFRALLRRFGGSSRGFSPGPAYSGRQDSKNQQVFHGHGISGGIGIFCQGGWRAGKFPQAFSRLCCVHSGNPEGRRSFEGWADPRDVRANP